MDLLSNLIPSQIMVGKRVKRMNGVSPSPILRHILPLHAPLNEGHRFLTCQRTIPAKIVVTNLIVQGIRLWMLLRRLLTLAVDLGPPVRDRQVEESQAQMTICVRPRSNGREMMTMIIIPPPQAARPCLLL